MHRIFTQNIDDLESLAGVDKEMIVQAHGTLQQGRECARLAPALLLLLVLSNKTLTLIN